MSIRPCPHVSGFVCIRNHFVADSKVYASTRIRIRCVFERPHVSGKTIRIRQICLQSMRYHMWWTRDVVSDCLTRVFCVNLCRETRLIRKLSFSSSETTIWLTKPDHQAFVRPGLTKNFSGRSWRLLLRRFTATFLATGIDRSRTKVARIFS